MAIVIRQDGPRTPARLADMNTQLLSAAANAPIGTQARVLVELGKLTATLAKLIDLTTT
jgi:hypothetical protein